MKNLLLVITFIAPFILSAQTEIGIKAGTNFSFPSKDLRSDFKNGTFGKEFGVYSREKKGKVFFIVEANYSNVSFKETGKKLSINSLKVPFLLEYGKKVKFSAGVAPSVTISSKVVGSEINNIGKINIFPTAGVSYSPIDRLYIHARAEYASLTYLEDKKYNPFTTSINIGYSLFKGN